MIIIIYIHIFFNQYKSVIECCRTYASIIHMDGSMIKETDKYKYNFWNCAVFAYTQNTIATMCCLRCFFSAGFVKRTQEKWSSNGTTSLHLGDVSVSYTSTSVSKNVVGGFGARREKTSEFCFKIFGRYWNPSSRLLMPSYARPVFVWGFKTPLLSSVANNGTGPKNWTCKSPKEMCSKYVILSFGILSQQTKQSWGLKCSNKKIDRCHIWKPETFFFLGGGECNEGIL